MKYCVLLWIVSVALAQSVTTVYQPDVNGNVVRDGSTVSTDGQHTQVMQNLNGRVVPLQQTDEKILSKDATGEVREQIVRKYDPNGQLVSTERTVIEERNRPGGFTRTSTTYASDINGALRETQHESVESNTQGSSTTTQTVIERPTIDGSMQTVEKRNAVTETGKDVSKEDETVYRRSQDGGFYPAVRIITDETKKGNQTITNSSLYEPIATADLTLSRQSVTTTTKAADGSVTTSTDYYAPAAPGVARENGVSPQLYEQDTVTRKKQTDGSVVETTTARRSSISEPGRLEAPIKVSETICTGNCDPAQKP